MEARKATDVMVLEIGRVTPVADYFVICSAETGGQIRAIGEAVEEAMSGAGVGLLAKEGHARARWVLLDFGAIVVHLFGPEDRASYNLAFPCAVTPIPQRSTMCLMT